MKRVTWTSDVVETKRSTPPPIPSVGTFIAHLVGLPNRKPRTYINALKSFKRNGTLYKAAAYVAPYCTHPSLDDARYVYECIAYPFVTDDAARDLKNCTSINQINAYIKENSMIKDVHIVYGWILAYVKLEQYIVKNLLQHTHPQNL